MTGIAIENQIKRLPPFPMVARKLVAAMRSETCSAADVSEILASDQALASQVLKLANSSFYGSSGTVASVPRAVVILGFAAVRSLALGLGLAKAVKEAAGDRDLSPFWLHSIHVAAASRALARRGGRVDPDEAFVAGLLHDIGWLVLELSDPGYSDALADVPHDQFLDAEAARTGWTHTRAGQKAARRWHLPEDLCHGIRFHHHPTQWQHADSSLTAHVLLGDLMSRVLGASWEPAPASLDLGGIAGAVGISLRQTQELLGATVDEVQRTRDFLDIAGIELELPRRPEAGPSGTALVVGTDAERMGWLAGQLSWHGLAVVPLREFLDDPARRAEILVIDPHGVTAEQAGKLAVLLRDRADRVGISGDPAGLASAFPDALTLETALGPRDLARILAGS